MTDLEKLVQWLQSYPEWGQMPLAIDYTDTQPVCAGLYPRGVEQVERREDVLGNVTVHCRQTFLLQRLTSGQQSSPEDAQWLMGFQSWVAEQSAHGLAPHFGEEPGMERLRAEKGMLKAASQTATGTYAVTLIAEYVKHY
jgi:hypothetical protein